MRKGKTKSDFCEVAVATPIGYIKIKSCENKIVRTKFMRDSWKIDDDYMQDENYIKIYDHCGFDILKKEKESIDDYVVVAAKELCEYFACKRTEFTVKICIEYESSFKKDVYEELEKIPYGETKSYGKIATKIGKKGSAQAVGQCMKRNEVAIFLPCHRVIGKSGNLTGYAGGIERKRFLLEMEKNAKV